MEKEYKKAFEGLNKAQRQAVNTTDGPVLVIAGPGTGKTQLLSTRVAHILKTTDTNAESILCLTFTNKAAANMKQRTMDLTGADGARVQSSTFHSFAADIMNSYPDYFWNAAKLAVAPGSLQLDVIESIVAKLPLDNPLALKFAGQFTLLNDIQNCIKLAKEAGLTPDKLRAILRGNLAYIDEIEADLADITEARLSSKALPELQRKVAGLPSMNLGKVIAPIIDLSVVLSESLSNAIGLDEDSGKTTNTGAWKKRWIQAEAGQRGMFDERRRNNWWLELADIYEQYREQIHIRGFYDYSDMLVETISQLEQNSEILASVQDRYNYVMIDEFQDTNPAQLRLAHLVADHHSANGKPNLMVVGDDDQSIFKFNGAELNNMLDFKRSYPAAKFIVLTDNYRSNQAVLDKSSQIINQAQTRLVSLDKSLKKVLIAVNAPPEKGIIKALSFSSRELQLSSIGREIKRLYKPNLTTAVLARNHDSLIRMTGILQSLGVPVRYEQQSNVLDHEVVRQVYLVMKALLAIQTGNKDDANALISQVVRAPFWAIDPTDLWQLALQTGRDDDWLGKMLASPVERVSSLANWLIWQAQASADQPLAVSIEQILGLRPAGDYTSPIKDHYANQQAGSNVYLHGLSAIQLLRSLVHEFSIAGQPSIEDFVRFIEVNKQNNKIVADESPFITGNNFVQLLTVHKAKGLEFDNVYVIDAIEDNWQARKGGRKPPANLPLRPAQDDFDDFVRLMYVAATRTRSSLCISAYSQNHAGQPVTVSPIVRNAFDIQELSEDKNTELISVLQENLRWPTLEGGAEKEMLKARLETYNLSVTAMLNFLDVSRGGPQYFKERNLLRLPEIKTPSQSFGTAVHSALEAAQKLVNKDAFEMDGVKSILCEVLKTEQLPRSDYIRYEKSGRQLLDRLFDKYGYELPKASLPEQNYKNIRLKNASISGKLDRVDRLGDSLRITDYKTGRPLTSLSTTDKNQAIKAYKHKTQLIFYALLTSRSSFYNRTWGIECQMVYVEADNQKNLCLSYTPTKEDLDRLTKLIEAVWSKVVNVDLPDTSGYSPDIDGILAFEADLIEGKLKN